MNGFTCATAASHCGDPSGPNTRNAKDPTGTWPVSPDLAQLHARHRALIVQKRERVNRIMQGKSAQNTGKRHTSETTKQGMQANHLTCNAGDSKQLASTHKWEARPEHKRCVPPEVSPYLHQCHHTPRLPDVNAATIHSLNTQHKLPCIHRGTPSLTQAACSHTAQVHPEHQCALPGKDVSL